MAKSFNRHGWLLSQLRRLSMKYPPRIKVLNAAKTTYYIDSKKGTKVKRVSFECSQCHVKGFKSKDVHMDHTIPVGEFINWEIYLTNLFCDESNFSVLCIPCHLTKSSEEAKERFFKKKK